MRLALFFEGTGQGVYGKKTNVSLLYESCVQNEEQRCHLENGPGAKFGSWFVGGAVGIGWRVIFSRARRWFEGNYERLPATSTSTKVFIFGFSRGALIARHFAAWLDKLGIEVEYLGLWDTVSASLTLTVSEECPANVRRARHALAADEQRRMFAYLPLKPHERSVPAGHPQVEEMIFPGSHSDVGGLYEDDHVLADCARDWVAEPAAMSGLKFTGAVKSIEVWHRPLLRERLKNAKRHDSRFLISNLWGLLGWKNRIFPSWLHRINF